MRRKVFLGGEKSSNEGQFGESGMGSLLQFEEIDGCQLSTLQKLSRRVLIHCQMQRCESSLIRNTRPRRWTCLILHYWDLKWTWSKKFLYATRINPMNSPGLTTLMGTTLSSLDTSFHSWNSKRTNLDSSILSNLSLCGR